MWSPGLWGANGETGPQGRFFYFKRCHRLRKNFVDSKARSHASPDGFNLFFVIHYVDDIM